MRKYYIWYKGERIEVSASLVYEYRDILFNTTLLTESVRNQESYVLNRMDAGASEEIKQKYEMLCKILRTKLGEEME